MPVSSILVLGVSNPHHHKGDRHGRPSYVLVLFTQSDLDPVEELPSLPRWPAQRLLPQERRDLAIQVLAGGQPVSDLAREHEVSRKFLYRASSHRPRRSDPLFDPEPKTEKVLFCCRLPSLGCGNWSWPWCSSAIVRPAAWSNCCATSSIIQSPWGLCTTSCTAPFLMPRESTSSTTSPPSSSASSMRSSRCAIPSWWGSMPNPPSASC